MGSTTRRVFTRGCPARRRSPRRSPRPAALQVRTISPSARRSIEYVPPASESTETVYVRALDGHGQAAGLAERGLDPDQVGGRGAGEAVVLGLPDRHRLRRRRRRRLRVRVLRLGALVEERRKRDRGEDPDDQDHDEDLDEREAVVGAEAGTQHVPPVVGAEFRRFRRYVCASAGWPSRAGAWASRAGVEAPGSLAPRAAHAVGLAAEAGDQLAGAAAGGAGAGVVLGGGAHFGRIG